MAFDGSSKTAPRVKFPGGEKEVTHSTEADDDNTQSSTIGTDKFGTRKPAAPVGGGGAGGGLAGTRGGPPAGRRTARI